MSNKYGAQPTERHGITFASKAEARRYEELRLLEMGGDITNLEVHPRYELVVNGVRVGRYTGDFRYVETSGLIVVEDVKSSATAKNTAYRLRKKLVWALYGIEIQEVM